MKYQIVERQTELKRVRYDEDLAIYDICLTDTISARLTMETGDPMESDFLSFFLCAADKDAWSAIPEILKRIEDREDNTNSRDITNFYIISGCYIYSCDSIPENVKSLISSLLRISEERRSDKNV